MLCLGPSHFTRGLRTRTGYRQSNEYKGLGVAIQERRLLFKVVEFRFETQSQAGYAITMMDELHPSLL
jgi:hypothetical protein